MCWQFTRGRIRQLLLIIGLEGKATRPGRHLAEQFEAPVEVQFARVRIARAPARHEELELHRFILHEALPGPVPSDPPHGLYRVTGPGQGEGVRLRGALVTVDDRRQRAAVTSAR